MVLVFMIDFGERGFSFLLTHLGEEEFYGLPHGRKRSRRTGEAQRETFFLGLSLGISFCEPQHRRHLEQNLGQVSWLSGGKGGEDQWDLLVVCIMSLKLVAGEAAQVEKAQRKHRESSTLP